MQLTKEFADKLLELTNRPVGELRKFIHDNTEIQYPVWVQDARGWVPEGNELTPDELQTITRLLDKFSWKATLEGHEYWSEVSQKLHRMRHALKKAINRTEG